MSIETSLQALAGTARQLLECEHASLWLHCSEEALRHPLLALFSVLHPSLPLHYGSFLNVRFLQDERLWLLCDRAMLTEQCLIEEIWRQQTAKEPEIIGSMLVVTLERPAGVIGFLLCASTRPDAFKEGEQSLLRCYGPELARRIEQIVSESCLTPPFSESEDGMQEQSVFLSLISHEVRAPLTAIKGYAALLEEYSGGQDSQVGISETQQKRYLTLIMEQTRHLEVLMGDVLDVSYMQSGRLALHCTCVDLGKLCQRLVQATQLRIDQQQPGQYCILCTIDQELPLVWADADRVQQILTNLLENALKYSPDGGLIEIQVSTLLNRSHQCACITVSDRGIGIPPQQQAALFRPFTRLEHPATQHVRGTGLGLYIARKLVEAMQGQVLLRSREGKGTTITFTLPFARMAETRMQHIGPVLSQQTFIH